MKSRFRFNVNNLDTYLYWVSIFLVVIGLFNNRLARMDAVVLSGIFFFCMVLKPMIVVR